MSEKCKSLFTKDLLLLQKIMHERSSLSEIGHIGLCPYKRKDAIVIEVGDASAALAEGVAERVRTMLEDWSRANGGFRKENTV